MLDSSLDTRNVDHKLSLIFSGEFTLYDITRYQKEIDSLMLIGINRVELDFRNLEFIDSAASIFVYNLQQKFSSKALQTDILCNNQDVLDMLTLIKTHKTTSEKIPQIKPMNFIQKLGKNTHINYMVLLSFIAFLGELFVNKLQYLASWRTIRYKEIFFEINESGVKALGIVALTSFLIGLVIAYQSGYQLKLYGANIFIVDMLGISILRELAPLITAIVIAGRSGSAFTAQIGAMKITEELDAMRTMGFDPYKFLVLPRIIALMISLPILIFLADIMAILGGMIVANIDLGISTELFIARFNEVIAAKHFFIGLIKGPFFAFLIAAIGIYRGLEVKSDTQSIGFNTTKSVVESIFAVIVCDAIFSIAFTKIGI